ncbi:hypothetical protein G7046_g9011 [Stylonectria norvegica]|nr:hypothetical protein G7046_g9011 [Stylonectria norvegica]
MEQTKALNALEPFLLLSKSASSPRAAADLITRATSSPNTFLFAELLATPAMQSLATAPDYAPHLTLLQIFSHGTYAAYRTTPGLPPLADPQALKLRQLSLLTLARDRANLSYAALQARPRPAPPPVTSRTSVSPLRDLPPGAIPDLAAALSTWGDRCTSTLEGLETQIKGIRAAAAVRQREQRVADDKMQQLVSEVQDAGGAGGRRNEVPILSRDSLLRKPFNLNKRSVMDVANLVENESMDVDEPEEEKKRASKRKM